MSDELVIATLRDPSEEVCRQLARHAARVEVVVTLRDPFRRLFGLLGLTCTLAAAAFAWFVVDGPPRLGVTVAVAVLTAAGWVALVWGTTRYYAARNCRRAVCVWWATADQPPRAASAVRGVSRRHRTDWLVEYVAARPTGHQLGTALMTQLCATADAEQATSWLVAVNRRVADFYTRSGFVRVRRHLVWWQWLMRRDPRPVRPGP